MAYSVCNNLIRKKWKSYAHDLHKAPEAEGIYSIGVERAGRVRYQYVGQTNNIRRRLKEHKNQNLEIDKFVKKKFNQRNAGETLRIKWAKEKDSKCTERKYKECIEEYLPYKLKYNRNRGNQCKISSGGSKGRARGTYPYKHPAWQQKQTGRPVFSSSRSGSATPGVAKLMAYLLLAS